MVRLTTLSRSFALIGSTESIGESTETVQICRLTPQWSIRSTLELEPAAPIRFPNDSRLTDGATFLIMVPPAEDSVRFSSEGRCCPARRSESRLFRRDRSRMVSHRLGQTLDTRRKCTRSSGVRRDESSPAATRANSTATGMPPTLLDHRRRVRDERSTAPYPHDYSSAHSERSVPTSRRK